MSKFGSASAPVRGYNMIRTTDDISIGASPGTISIQNFASEVGIFLGFSIYTISTLTGGATDVDVQFTVDGGAPEAYQIVSSNESWPLEWRAFSNEGYTGVSQNDRLILWPGLPYASSLKLDMVIVASGTGGTLRFIIWRGVGL